MTNTITGTRSADALNGDTNPSDLFDFIDGQAGADSLFGGAANDTLRGGVGNDSLNGGAGLDTLDGNVGTDILVASLGFDVISGGDGDDRLVFTAGSGQVGSFNGGAGFDTLDLSGLTTGTAQVSGLVSVELQILREVADTWFGSNDSETIEGRGGNDTLQSGLGNDTLLGGEGDDWVFTGTGDDSLDGGPGQDLAFVGSATGGVVATLGGTAVSGDNGTDQLRNFEGLIGGTFDDVLTGDGLNNNIAGNLGNDTLNGGGGVDGAFYNGSASAVTVNLAAGTASGGQGNDSLQGFENIVGSPFGDTLIGNAAANTIFSFPGNDTASGGNGADTLHGGEGDDSLEGGLAGDQLFGGLGNDIVLGGGGNDLLVGEAGDDTLTGGEGQDLMEGGEGGDLYVFTAIAHSAVALPDAIATFVPGAGDRIDVAAIDASGRNGDQAFELVTAFTDRAGEMRFTYDSVTNLTLVEFQTDRDADVEMALNVVGQLTTDDGFIL